MSCDRWQKHLQAYTDDSCTPEAAAEFEAHLRECPACAVEALALERLKRATRTHAMRYSPSADFQDRMAEMLRGANAAADLEPAVERPTAKEIIRNTGKRKGTLNWPWMIPQWAPTLAGVALVVLTAVMAGIWTQHEAHREAMAELVDMHVATLASVNPVDVVSTDRHTVKPWFAGKLPFTFNLPEMQNSAYRLIGGKLVYLDGRPAAQLVYAVGKHDISVFISEEHPASSFSKILSVTGESSRREKGFTVERWRDAGLSYVMISDTNSSDVQTLAEMLRNAARP